MLNDVNLCNPQLLYPHIAASKIRQMCTAVSETLQGSLVYLQSNGYPANIPPGDSSCTCSVETSICNATLNLYTIDRRFKVGRFWCMGKSSNYLFNSAY